MGQGLANQLGQKGTGPEPDGRRGRHCGCAKREELGLPGCSLRQLFSQLKKKNKEIEKPREFGDDLD